MRKFRIIMLLMLLFGSVSMLKATHYMGGEITWECIPAGQPNAGKLIFTIKYYRECYTPTGSPAATFPVSLTLKTTHPSVSGVGMKLLKGWPKDISPQCYLDSGKNIIVCPGMENPGANKGAVQEYIYKSQPVSLPGVPPPGGWTLYSDMCCRNPSDNVQGQPGWYLRAKMYAFQNKNYFPCYDNSPTFAEVPKTVICTGYPFKYNHNAYDEELDSLVYEWGVPKINANTSVTYKPTYTYQHPLPGRAQDPRNVPAIIDPHTGVISFESYTNGAFVTSTKVSAYKCGVKIAEIWRDMQVVLLTCGKNTPPNVTPPFDNGTSFTDTVYAGENVSFALNGSDFEFLPTGVPQTMSIEASGAQFGSFVPPTNPNGTGKFVAVGGCIATPCATLDPAPGVGPDGTEYEVTGVFGIQTAFDWETTCDHLGVSYGCAKISNVYTFVLKVLDNYCPAPAINISTVVVVVQNKPEVASPPIQCLKVLPSGDVQLDWSVPEDELGWSMPQDEHESFQYYTLSSSQSPAGPFQVLDTIRDIDITTYEHKGANAHLAPVYYVLETTSGCPGHDRIAPADTFSTMNLTVVNTMNGAAQLNWNPTIDPLLNTSTAWYHIYREYPKGVWLLMDSTQNTSYIDPIIVCSDTVSYRVEIADTLLVNVAGDTSMCFSVSNVGADLFEDITPPNVPVVDSVSINPNTGFAELAWDTNAMPDTRGYIIYLSVNNSMTPVDTVFGDTNTFYTDTINMACQGDGSYNSYAVAAFDSCDNVSPMSTQHQTMNIVLYKDICNDKIKVTWNTYDNMSGGVMGYQVYVSENGGVPILLNTNSSTVATYDHVGLNHGSEYCYFVRALSLDGITTSSSCIVCENANKPRMPEFTYIRSASVLQASNLGIDLRMYLDTAGKASYYRLERSKDEIAWENLDTLSHSYTDPNLTYRDEEAMPSQIDYFYRMVVIDSCGNESDTSNVVRTMHLTVEPNDSLQNELAWNQYEGYNGSPLIYEIYRSVDGVWDPNPIAPPGSLPAGQTTYKDNVSDFYNSGGTFEYFVVAIEGPGNVHGFADSSASNAVVALQNPRLYIPTAFNPNSNVVENQTFYPQGVYINSGDYLFMVYDRWGRKVFETTEINYGWDGTDSEGKKLPGDVYTYYVRFSTSSGNLYEDRGTITLVR